MHVPVMVSDEGLRTAILEALATNGQTSRLNLRVGVLNGIAHLAGSAGTMAERAVAEEIDVVAKKSGSSVHKGGG